MSYYLNDIASIKLHKSPPKETPAIVKKILNKTIMMACKKFNVAIITNPINESAFHHIYLGANTKPASISKKTETKGILSGLIIADKNDDHSKTVYFNDKDGDKYYFIKKNNNIIDCASIEYTNKDANFIKIITDDDGRVITSDLDILMILSNSNKDRTIIPESFGFGSVLKYELEVIQYINYTFEQKLRKNRTKPNLSFGPIIRHGPFNRFYKAKSKFIKFPLTVYEPNNNITDIPKRYDKYHILAKKLHELSNNNFIIEVPDDWRELCYIL